MLEALLGALGGGSTQTPGISDGRPTLLAGTTAAGYYGVVSSDQLITGDALAAAIGLSAGTSINSNAGWLKFSYNSKPLYVAKMPLRDGTNWQAVYQAGAVYGDDTIGLYPSGANRLQNARVTIGTMTCRVRLMRVSTTDPGAANAGGGREFSDLFVRVKTGGGFDNLTDAVLGLSSGFFMTGMESVTGNTNACLEMNNQNLTSWDTKTAANSGNYHIQWRPVLEPI